MWVFQLVLNTLIFYWPSIIGQAVEHPIWSTTSRMFSRTPWNGFSPTDSLHLWVSIWLVYPVLRQRDAMCLNLVNWKKYMYDELNDCALELVLDFDWILTPQNWVALKMQLHMRPGPWFNILPKTLQKILPKTLPSVLQKRGIYSMVGTILIQ